MEEAPNGPRSGSSVPAGARVFLCLLGIALGTAVLTVLTAFNGYCGDSGPSDSDCSFHVKDQVVLLAIWCPIVAVLVAVAVVRLPRPAYRRTLVGAGFVTLACLAATWVLLVHGTTETLNYWHSGGRSHRPGDASYWLAVLFAVATPFAAAAFGQTRRGALQLFAYAGGASAISWMLAFSWTAYYYDRHL